MKALSAILFATFIVCCFYKVQASNVTVSDMTSLQTALTGTADTIYITPDSYIITTAFTINRSVRIIGVPSTGNEVILKMTGTVRHFNKTSTAIVELNNLVLIGPNADYIAGIIVANNGTSVGGGIISGVTGSMIINNCKIGGCYINGNGGGLAFTNSGATMSLSNSLVTANAALNGGGGVYCLGTLTLENDTISFNKAGYDITTGILSGNYDGGGVFANSVLTLRGMVTVTNNSTSRNGGGMYKGSGVVNNWEIGSLNVSDNNANNDGGGIHITVADSIVNAVIRNNRAGTFGGGIVATASIIIISCKIESNRAGLNGTTSGNGGGIYTSASNVSATVIGSVINDNRAFNNGGGMYTSGPLILNNDTISVNRACYDSRNAADTFRSLGSASGTVCSGGGIFANNSITLLGTIVLERDTTVFRGGGVYKGATGNLTADSNIDTTGLATNPDTIFTADALDTLIMNYCVTTGEVIKKNGDPNECHGGAIYTGSRTKIRKARFFRNSSGDSGAAIWGQNVDITLENVTAIEGKAGYNPYTRKYYADCSGGVSCTSGNITLSGTILFQRDSAANTGGALSAFGANSTVSSIPDSLVSLTITECGTLYVTDTFGFFVPNFRGQGGAIVANKDISLSAIDTIRILNNTSYTHGGGLYSVTGGIAVSRANISGNTARFHGGALYAPNGSVFIDSCRLSRNRAGFNPFLQMDSGAYNGGAIYASKDLRLRGGIVMDSNTANNNGGAIAKVAGGKFDISQVTILRLRGNQTIGGPGGKGNGGAIYIEDSLVLNSSINLEITNNRAAANGGAIYSKDKFLSLNEITLGNNHADSSGGAIWSGGPLELIKVALDSNSSGLQGGAVYNAAGKVAISGSTFFMDSATNGGALYSSTNSIADTSRIVNSTFSQNYASNDGGAMYLADNAAPARLTFTSINGNMAGSGNSHAIFLSSTANKLLRGNLIYGNGNGGAEVNQTNFPSSSYNIVRGVLLTGGTANLDLAPGNGGNIFETIASGDIAVLANNGGLTQTLAIKKNGYAHNYVPMDSSNVWVARILSFTTDQRDSLRSAGCKADAGSYELQTVDDVANYALRSDTVCNNSIVDADTLITASQFIIDTLYYSDSSFLNEIAMPVQVTEQVTTVYVKFVTSSNCELFDTIKIVTSPIVGDIGERDSIFVTNTLQLTSTTPGGAWTSNNPGIATVNQSGLVTGVAVGETQILYTVEDMPCGTTRTVTDTITVLVPILPLTLVSFSGNRQNGNDYLKWTTAQEFNTSHFDIESSTDAVTFVKAGEIIAGSNSDIQLTYTFTNNNIQGIAFYRLKMVDIDGSFRYSAVIRIFDSIREGPYCINLNSISPIPFSNDITLNIISCQQQAIQFVIVDMSGKLIKTGILQVQKGNGYYLINQLNLFESGLYIIKGVGANGDAFAQKIVKQ